jgi:two-component system, NtrC family, sensor kinase
VRPGALAEAVTQLSWVPPTAPSLLALARPFTPATWSVLRRDPGAVLLFLRVPTISRLAPDHFTLPEVARSPEVLESALGHLRDEGEGRLPDWSVPGRAAVLESCLLYARQARRLARRVRRCDPDKAWAAGLLAPLGWVAMAICSPHEVADCLDESAFARDPGAAQRDRWEMDHAEIARRLARRWVLPPWLSALTGHLALPLDVARDLGADPVLFPLTQLAIGLVQQQGKGLSLAVGATVTELLAALGLPSPRALEVVEEDEEEEEDPQCTGHSPQSLVDLLELAAENRRLRAARGGERLEEELDILHRALEEQRGREDERLKTQKLRALAEFAAGAGHEINNPLAVISGQAQYLLAHEAEPARRKSLETIIGQTQRIHQLLRDVMQFARPPAPNLQPVDLVRLVDEVGVALEEYAQGRKVRLRIRDAAEAWERTVPSPPLAEPPLLVMADAWQLRTALTCLLRNAIEAAPADGWASIRLETQPGQVEVVVEDCGPELPPTQREHLFDPFYSGRPAGRGTGLGLPTAWSLARQQDGDVFLASQAGEPTRFVLRLPLPAEQTAARAG